MEKHLLVLKPNLKCAIAPLYVKSILKMLPAGILLLVGAFMMKFFNVIEVSSSDLAIAVVAVFFALAFFPMKYKLMNLHFTTYYFYKTHVTSIFKFIKVKRNSLPYTQITNVKIHVSFWERICRAGKIALNASGKGANSMILPYIKKPHEVEEKLQSLMHKYYEDTTGKAP